MIDYAILEANPTWTVLKLNLDLYGEKLMSDHLNLDVDYFFKSNFFLSNIWRQNMVLLFTSCY
jgi:hypothetical protein